MRPEFGTIGVPPGHTKAKTRGAELQDDLLITEIETQGARLAWSRATICPCRGFSDEMRQPDPTCSRCHGGAVAYFGAKNYEVPADAGELNDLQKLIVEANEAMVIRGVIQRVTQAQDFYDVLGNWVRGTMQLSVRPENKLGYYDKIVNLDSEISFSQIIVVTDTAAPLALRYPATGVNAVFDENWNRFDQAAEFTLVDGQIVWSPGLAPAVGTRLTVHYLMHPTWLVVDHPHVFRESQRRRKLKVRKTPTGNPAILPLQASVRYAFLPTRELPPPP